jgi:hypothetical protein
MALVAESRASANAERAAAELIKKREIVAQKRQDYFAELSMVVTDKIVDAEEHLGRARKRGDEVGLGPRYGGVWFFLLDLLIS